MFLVAVILRISQNGKKNKAGTHGIGLYPLFFVVLVKIGEAVFRLHPILALFGRFLILFLSIV